MNQDRPSHMLDAALAPIANLTLNAARFPSILTPQSSNAAHNGRALPEESLPAETNNDTASFFRLPIEIVGSILGLYMADFTMPEREYPVQRTIPNDFDQDSETLQDLRHLRSTHVKTVKKENRAHLAMDTLKKYRLEYTSQSRRYMHNKFSISYARATSEQLLSAICGPYTFPGQAQRIELQLKFNQPTVNEVDIEPSKKFIEDFKDLSKATVTWTPTTVTLNRKPGADHGSPDSPYIEIWITRLLRAHPGLTYMRLNNGPHQTLTPSGGLIIHTKDQDLLNHRELKALYREASLKRMEERVRKAIMEEAAAREEEAAKAKIGGFKEAASEFWKQLTSPKVV